MVVDKPYARIYPIELACQLLTPAHIIPDVALFVTFGEQGERKIMTEDDKMEKEMVIKDLLVQYPDSVLSKGYGIVGKTVMQDKRISIGAKGLYAYLASFGTVSYPKKTQILDETCMGKNAYQKYMHELVEYGYISITRRRVKKVAHASEFGGNVYTINLRPQDVVAARQDGKNLPQPHLRAPVVRSPMTRDPMSRVPMPREPMESDSNNTISNITKNNKTTTAQEVTEHRAEKQKLITTEPSGERATVSPGASEKAVQVPEAEVSAQSLEVQPVSAVHAVVAALCNFDMNPAKAAALVKQYGVEAVKQRIEQVKHKAQIGNKAGWIISALRGNYVSCSSRQSQAKPSIGNIHAGLVQVDGIWVRPEPEQTKAYRNKQAEANQPLDWEAMSDSPFKKYLPQCGGLYQQYLATKGGVQA